MSTPLLKLCERATGYNRPASMMIGGDFDDAITALKQLRARFSPDVARAVYEALQDTARYYAEDMPDGPEKADLRFVTRAYRDAYSKTLTAIRLLDGEADEKGEP